MPSRFHYLYVRPVAARIRRSRRGPTLLLGPLGSRGSFVMPRPLLSRGGPLRILGYPSLIAILRGDAACRTYFYHSALPAQRPGQLVLSVEARLGGLVNPQLVGVDLQLALVL